MVYTKRTCEWERGRASVSGSAGHGQDKRQARDGNTRWKADQLATNYLLPVLRQRITTHSFATRIISTQCLVRIILRPCVGSPIFKNTITRSNYLTLRFQINSYCTPFLKCELLYPRFKNANYSTPVLKMRILLQVFRFVTTLTPPS